MKNETIDALKNWAIYPFENDHPLKEQRLDALIESLLDNEDVLTDETAFRALLNGIDNLRRSDDEIGKAFAEYTKRLNDK